MRKPQKRIKQPIRPVQKLPAPLFQNGAFDLWGAGTHVKKYLSGSIENVIKFVGFFASACYIVGLVITNSYFSFLSIRAIHLIDASYIPAGILFLMLFFLAFLPVFSIGKTWVKLILWLAGQGGFIAVFYMFLVTNLKETLVPVNSMRVYLGKLTGDELYEASLVSAQSVVFILLTAVAVFLLVYVLFSGVKEIRLFSKTISWDFPLMKFFSVFMAIVTFLALFISAIFPSVSTHFGGGKLPTAEISFSEQIPDNILQAFNMQDTAGQPPEYYAKIVYTSDDTIFLKPYPWYETEIYELHKEDVKYLIYVHDLPSDIEDPNE